MVLCGNFGPEKITMATVEPGKLSCVLRFKAVGRWCGQEQGRRNDVNWVAAKELNLHGKP